MSKYGRAKLREISPSIRNSKKEKEEKENGQDASCPFSFSSFFKFGREKGKSILTVPFSVHSSFFILHFSLSTSSFPSGIACAAYPTLSPGASPFFADGHPRTLYGHDIAIFPGYLHRISCKENTHHYRKWQ